MKRALLGIAAVMILAGCANRPAVILDAQFEAPYKRPAPAPTSKVATPVPAKAPCRLRIAKVGDARDDTQYMGEVISRPIRAVDSAAWVRSGLESLGQDTRFVLVQGDGPADMEISAHLLKAYARAAATTKTASVALDMTFRPNGRPEISGVYRGDEESPDWFGGDEEIKGILNSALADAVAEVQKDLLTYCPV